MNRKADELEDTGQQGDPVTPSDEVDSKPDVEGALFRHQWRESSEYRDLGRWRSWALGVGAFLAATVSVVWFVVVAGRLNMPAPLPQILGAYAAAFAFLGPLFVATLRLRDARRAFEDRMTLGLVSDLQNEERALAQSEDGKTDLASLWAITQKRIDLYHGIATAQAQKSFRVGQIAAIAGFMAVLGLGAIAAFAQSGTAAVAASVVGVAGAAMSAYIGATFMKAQAAASAQLRQFFLQPVEFSRMLGVERLLTDLPDSDRAAAVMQIIASTMPPSDRHADANER